MSKYIPKDLIKSLSSKICRQDDTYFTMCNGTRYTGKICNPDTADFSSVIRLCVALYSCSQSFRL